MSKHFFIMIVIVLAVFIAAPVCAQEQDKGNGVSVAGEQPPVSMATETILPSQEPAVGEVSVMDMPVNFSTPQDVEESIEKVRLEAGEAEALRLENALGYILAYDLSLERDKDKMYKKLNGRTPNAIIAKMKR